VQDLQIPRQSRKPPRKTPSLVDTFAATPAVDRVSFSKPSTLQNAIKDLWDRPDAASITLYTLRR
jgi:hypothetical protein